MRMIPSHYPLTTITDPSTTAIRFIAFGLATLGLAGLGQGSPIDSTAHSLQSREIDLVLLREELRGIYWSDDLPRQCGQEKLQILIDSTRKSLEVANFRRDVDTPRDSAAWNRYFMYGGHASNWHVSRRAKQLPPSARRFGAIID